MIHIWAKGLFRIPPWPFDYLAELFGHLVQVLIPKKKYGIFSTSHPQNNHVLPLCLITTMQENTCRHVSRFSQI